MEEAILRTLIFFLATFGLVLLLSLIIALREKQSNIWLRLLGWMFVLPLFLFAIYFGGLFFLAVVTFTALHCAWEFYRLAEQNGITVFRTTGTIFAAALPVLTFYDERLFPVTLTLFLLWLLALPIYKRQIARDLSVNMTSIAVTVLGILYAGWTMSYLILIRNLPNGLNCMLYLYLLVILNDGAAYYGGKFFGRTKVFDQVSPNKTLAGFISGILATIMGAYLISYLLPSASWYCVLLLGIVIAVSGGVGDLVESAIKRESKVKDAGSILPGLGGLLDRFDSLIYAAPVFYLFLTLVLCAQ